MIMFMRGPPPQFLSAWALGEKEREKERDRLHRKEIDHGLYALFVTVKRS